MPLLEALLVHHLELVAERLELSVVERPLDEREEVVFLFLDVLEDELPQRLGLRAERDVVLGGRDEAHQREARDGVLFERLEHAIPAALVELLPNRRVEDLLLDHEVRGERVRQGAEDVGAARFPSLEAPEEQLQPPVLALEQRGRLHGSARCEPRAAAAAVSTGAWHERCTSGEPEGGAMLYYALVFFIIALIAGFFGFFGIASSAAWIAKALFIAFLILAVVSLLVGRRRIV